MAEVYPIYLQEANEGGYCVRIPDFDQYTEGKDLADAILMARDAIGQMGVYYEDKGKEIPSPFSAKVEMEKNEIKSLIDVDFTEYREKNENRLVKKNCTIPYYLEREAEKRGINFSRVLTEELARRLAPGPQLV